MIDLHILNHAASTRPDWLEKCLNSAEQAAASGHCTVHIIDNPGDHVGASRAKAYALGEHPYVACLDNDDELIPDGLQPLLAALEKHPKVCGVYSNRTQINDQGKRLFTLIRGPWSPLHQLRGHDFPHQLAIYRRQAIIPHLDALNAFQDNSDVVLAGLATEYGPWLHVPVLAYQRRENDYYVNHRRPIDNSETQRGKKLITPSLLKHPL